MKHVRPLKTDKLPKQLPPPPLPPKRARTHQSEEAPVHAQVFSIPDSPQPIPASHNQGAQPKQFKALQKGELPIERALDIHGFTLAAASLQVPLWLARCQQQGLRVVRIIHGQGRNPHHPSIKQLIREGLLHAPELVLAFCDAPVSQGSIGATLVLLRR